MSPRQFCASFDPPQQIQLCRGVAFQLLRVGEWELAENFLAHAVDLATDIKADSVTDLWSEMAHLLLRKGDWNRAATALERAWSAMERHPCTDKARVFNAMGLKYFNMGEWRRSEEFYQRAMASSGGGPGVGYARLNLAVLQASWGNYDLALETESELLRIFRDTGDELAFAVVWANMLYQHTECEQIAEIESMMEYAVGLVTSAAYAFLHYDLTDTILLYQLNSGQLDRAAELMGRLKVLLESARYEAKRPWFAMRDILLMREGGQAERAMEKYYPGVLQEQGDSLARAHALIQMLNCARVLGRTRVASQLERVARQQLYALGFERGVIDRALAEGARESRDRRRKANNVPRDAFAEYVGGGCVVTAVKRLLEIVAGKPITLLLGGESGTGKSLLARLIHRASMRSGGPFIRFDCTCNDEGLVESLLFGHQKGAFTGAVESRKGLVDLAAGGTLFIDEVGELPLGLQGKLLTLLEEGTYRPVGGTASRQADVRFIVATNRNLEREVAERRFREDLYFRLGDLKVELPPLRQHPEDIPELVRAFLQELNARHGERRTVSLETLRVLQEQPWPGNTRQLKKALERGYLLSEGTAITLRDMGVDATGADLPPVKTLEELEREHIHRILGLVAGNRSKAARLLGVKRTTLYSRMDSLGIN